MWTPTIQNCDNYMDERQGRYEYRAVRYRHAIDWMLSKGLTEGMTVVDVGAGMTEFGFCMMNEYGLRVRYIPVDGGIDGTDLNHWEPARDAHFFVALELVEHLTNWKQLVKNMKSHAITGVCLSTPNPLSTDVIGMDPTHVCEVHASELFDLDFKVQVCEFYGRVFNKPGFEQCGDSLFAGWSK